MLRAARRFLAAAVQSVERTRRPPGARFGSTRSEPELITRSSHRRAHRRLPLRPHVCGAFVVERRVVARRRRRIGAGAKRSSSPLGSQSPAAPYPTNCHSSRHPTVGGRSSTSVRVPGRVVRRGRSGSSREYKGRRSHELRKPSLDTDNALLHRRAHRQLPSRRARALWRVRR
jgi:hypothetical protein